MADIQSMNERLQGELDTLSAGETVANWETQISDIVQWYVNPPLPSPLSTQHLLSAPVICAKLSNLMFELIYHRF